MLCNITPTSLRSRLAGLRQEGMWVPVAGLSRVDRERRGELRSAWALARYLDGQPLVEVRQRAALSREAFRTSGPAFPTLNELMVDFALSPVKARALREIAEEMLGALSDSRPDEDMVYWAVGSTDPAGKPPSTLDPPQPPLIPNSFQVMLMVRVRLNLIL